jgi:hypothetical protein
VSVTAVHSDKVPMVPNFGQQPRLIVTIQPAGARFDPPAKLTLPNVEGLEPGEVTELYSFDHDLGHFVSIGPGTVTADGALIVSNPGVGIVKAGWHCGGNPSSSGTTHQCEACRKCEDNCCKPDPGQEGAGCDDKKLCTVKDKCVGGTCRGEPIRVQVTSFPTVVCVGASKAASATIAPTDRYIFWRSQSTGVATVDGGVSGTSALVAGKSKGTATIEIADSETYCGKISRSVQVIDKDEFDGAGEKTMCAGAGIGTVGFLAVGCARAGYLGKQVQNWELQTFKKECRGEGSPGDAARHARWSCELYSSSVIPNGLADGILRRHENRPTDPCVSHEQDLNNNEVGRRNAEAQRDCTASALAALAAGALQVNNPPPAGVACP